MITLLLEDNDDDRYWKLQCDSCKYTITYGYSREIEDWEFRKKLYVFHRKTLLFLLQTQLNTV